MSYSKRYRERTIEYRQDTAWKRPIKFLRYPNRRYKNEFWFSNQLLPSLEQGTVIVMDNASFHSQKRLSFAAQNAGCRLLFLPPYSPELNPIENFWAWLKRFVKKILPAAPSFDDALCTAFQLW